MNIYIKITSYLYLYIFLTFSYIAHANIAFSNFSLDEDGWGSSKWNTITNANGLSLNNPYLLVDPNGNSPKKKMILYNNHSDWTDDLITKGATGIQMDVKNTSVDSLRMRIALGDTGNPMSGTWFVSSSATEVSSSDDWTSIYIPILAGDMQKADNADMMSSPGPLTYAEVMSNVHTIRIISQGSPYNATGEEWYDDVYFDNIQMIPEPQTISIITSSLLLLMLYRNYKHNITIYDQKNNVVIPDQISSYGNIKQINLLLPDQHDGFR